jgi:hypothetical protein
MTASSTTGVGRGSSNKATVKELSALANAPSILIAGVVESEGIAASPPADPGNEVVFPTPIIGGSENFIVLLTTQNGGYAYITSMNENDDGNFSGFNFATESECTLMYLVTKIGQKPTI